jgi:hypothetical protein
LALSLGERAFDIAQFEPHVFAEPDAGNSPGALLGPHPRFVHAEVPCKLIRRQEFLRIARTCAFVFARARRGLPTEAAL